MHDNLLVKLSCISNTFSIHILCMKGMRNAKDFARLNLERRSHPFKRDHDARATHLLIRATARCIEFGRASEMLHKTCALNALKQRFSKKRPNTRIIKRNANC